MPPYKHLPIFWVYHINVECMWNHLILQDFSFHLPKRTGHFPDKTPLALHIGFQIFRALPICLPDCFPLLRQKAAPSKVKTLSELYHKKFSVFHPMAWNDYFSGMESKKEPSTSPCPPANIFQFYCILSRKTPYYHGNSYTNTKTLSSFRACIISPVFQQHFQPNRYPFPQKPPISYTLLPFRFILSRKPRTFAWKYTFAW